MSDKMREEKVNQTYTQIRSKMDKDLKETSYRKHFVVDNVSELPKKIVGLIAPTT